MPTSEQWRVIKMIEENLDIKFRGETKREATTFIRYHLEESKKVSDYYKKLLLINFGGYRKVWELLIKYRVK